MLPNLCLGTIVNDTGETRLMIVLIFGSFFCVLVWFALLATSKFYMFYSFVSFN